MAFRAMLRIVLHEVLQRILTQERMKGIVRRIIGLECLCDWLNETQLDQATQLFLKDLYSIAIAAFALTGHGIASDRHKDAFFRCWLVEEAQGMYDRTLCRSQEMMDGYNHIERDVVAPHGLIFGRVKQIGEGEFA